MIRHLLTLTLLLPGPLAAQWRTPRGLPEPIEVRLQVEEGGSAYQNAAPTRLQFQTSEDAHVVVARIDTEGRLEFLFPRGPWENDLVERRRPVTLPARNPRQTPEPPGIGYYFVLASPVPLDYRAFDAGRRAWDWSSRGPMVQGDPFQAFDEIARALLPPRGYTAFGSDYSTYYIGPRVAYPRYACTGPARKGPSGWGHRPDWTDCDEVQIFLKSNPGYFDARTHPFGEHSSPTRPGRDDRKDDADDVRNRRTPTSDPRRARPPARVPRDTVREHR